MPNIEQITKRLDQLLNDYIAQDGAAAGMAVGIVYNREPVYAKGFGVKSKETGAPVDENTLFHMASISKTYVATAVMQLVERGQIKLDEKVTAYLTYFKLEDTRYQDITIRHMLTHTSGMPDEDDYEWDRPQLDAGALERYVRSVSNRELLWEPGQGTYAYSNIAFEVLGDVIAKVSGVSFEQYMQEHILDVLGMETSTYTMPDADQGQLAAPHIMGMGSSFGAKVSRVYPYNRAHGPSSTLLTSAAESCSYAAAYLNGGKWGTAPVLQPSSIEELWQSHAPADDFGYYRNIGLGWFMGPYKGLEAKAHGGSDTGFRSNLVVLPEPGIAVTLMFNTDYLGLHQVNNAILDVLLGEQVEVIPRSLTMHAAGILATEGIDSALSVYKAGSEQRSKLGYVPYEFDFGFQGIAGRLLRGGELDGAAAIVDLALALDPDDQELRLMKDQLADTIARS